MTNAELMAKIKAEIERRMNEIKSFRTKPGDEYVYGHLSALKGILSFLDTLEEPVCEELEEAATDYMYSREPEFWDLTNSDKAMEAFKAGANWQKEQMMKEAVEGTYNNSDWGTPCVDLPSPLELERFDKVRIIIVKE